MYPYVNGFFLYGASLLAGLFILLRNNRKDPFNSFLGFIILKPLLPFAGLVLVGYIRTIFFSKLIVSIEALTTIFAFIEIVTTTIILYYYRQLFSKAKLVWVFYILDTVRWISFVLISIIYYTKSLECYDALCYFSQLLAVCQPVFMSVLAIIVSVFDSKFNNEILNGEKNV